jgi:hypothetical protein
MLPTQYTFLQLIKQLINASNKIQFMTNINPLHVSLSITLISNKSLKYTEKYVLEMIHRTFP